MRIALIDSFFDTSHQLWAEGLVKYSRFSIDIYAGSAHHWKWKMTGGTYELAKDFVASGERYDLLLLSDMVNLPLFRSLLPPALFTLPVVLYFHENQITYPWSGTEKREDRNYGWINYMSACQADVCLYNSRYHLESFTDALPDFLKPFPRFDWKSDHAAIVEKSRVMHIGLDLPVKLFDLELVDTPIFIWNHRWEYDKGPEVFFNTLIGLKRRGLDFKLIVLGKEYKRSPAIFEEAKILLASHILHWGWVETKEDYRKLLLKANILFVTSTQDFFGISIVEALAYGCLPILPNRLAYPEHIPIECHDKVFYDESDVIEDFVFNLVKARAYKETTKYSNYVRKYDWSQMIENYDNLFQEVFDKVGS